MNKTLSLILTFTLIALPCIAQLRGKVIKVADGDTFTMLTANHKQVKIRLHGIDCPELAQPFGARAKQFASDMIFSKEVYVQVIDTDRYGRVVGIARLDNRIVNEELLLTGLAWHYIRFDKSERYAHLQSEAILKRHGLWRDTNPVAPWDWRKGKRDSSR